MKKTFYLLFFLLSIKSFSQADYAIINIYRSQAICLGCAPVQVLLDGKSICSLTSGTQLEYHVFQPGNMLLTITDGLSYTKSLNVDVRKGGVYYFEADARLPRFLGFNLKQLDKPIKKGKMSENSILRLSDTGAFVAKVESTESPDTYWTEEKLKNHWRKNGIADYEGIYERVSGQIEYKLAVLKENNDYRIIYLAGATGTGWQIGDIKATLKKTAQLGLFRSDWRMMNKTYNKDVNITFEVAKMVVVSDASSQDLYVKMYPTYDQDQEM